MSLTRWILDRILWRQPKPSATPRTEDVLLYLRRMEDRRVLSVTAVSDAYFVDSFQSSFFAPDQLGLISNDINTDTTTTLEATPDIITTNQGGTVFLNSDGSFDYFSPFSPGFFGTDHFVYEATNGIESSFGDVTLFIGEVPIQFETPTVLPIFGVESETPSDLIEVTLFSPQGASLTLLDTTNIVFTFGNNGDDDISFLGTADDVNKALDTFEYTPPIGFAGFADLFFGYGGDFGAGFEFVDSYIVPIFVEPPPGGGGPDGGGGPGGGGQVIGGPGGPHGDIFPNVDFYFVDSGTSAISFSQQAGVLSNDFYTGEGSLFAVSDTITTDLGGTVELFSDGSFTYILPTGFGSNAEFIDFFDYEVTDEITSAFSFVVLFVGEIPTFEDSPAPLGVFTAETPNDTTLVTVQLSSAKGAALTLFETTGVTFLSGFNGGSAFTIQGAAKDVNLALDFLDYFPPLDFSGDDFVTFFYEYNDGRGPIQSTQVVPVDVDPIADSPGLLISPNPVDYLPNIPVAVNINPVLVDVDGSEILGFVILDDVPMGVIPTVGQQSAIEPDAYFILPSELPNLKFIIAPEAPEHFFITVIATTIETTDEPGEFGGPGGPLLPDDPFHERFAFSVSFVDFFRLPPPAEPPPMPQNPPPMMAPMQTQVVFLLGPLSGPQTPPPKLQDGPKDKGPQDAPPPPPPAASVSHSHDTSGFNHTGNSPIASTNGPNIVKSENNAREEQNDEQSRRSYETSGIYVRKLGGDGPGQIAELPAELSEDYAQFMAFLKTLPNGDYIVYFKRSGQSHEQASLRQTVVKVRVINHRLNPDPGEYKPAGEVAEPPQDPNAPPITTEAQTTEERAELPVGVEAWMLSEFTLDAPDSISTERIPLAASTWMAAVASWKLNQREEAHSNEVDERMTDFIKKPSRRFRRRKPVKS